MKALNTLNIFTKIISASLIALIPLVIVGGVIMVRLNLTGVTFDNMTDTLAVLEFRGKCVGV